MDQTNKILLYWIGIPLVAMAASHLLGFGLLFGAMSGTPSQSVSGALATKYASIEKHIDADNSHSESVDENVFRMHGDNDQSIKLHNGRTHRFDVLDRKRFIKLIAPIEVKSVLASGEARPSRDTELLFLKLRARDYARRECTYLLKELMTECLVGAATVVMAHDKSVRKDRRHRYVMKARIHFVQKNLNTTPDSGTKSLKSSVFKVLPLSRYTPTQSISERRKVYRTVAKKCRYLAKHQEHCTLMRFSLGHKIYSSGGKHKVHLNADVVYSVAKANN